MEKLAVGDILSMPLLPTAVSKTVIRGIETRCH